MLRNGFQKFQPCVVSTATRNFRTSAVSQKDAAAAINRKKPLMTYEMARSPVHVGVSKGWMTWNTQNLEEFRQQQPYTVAQDEVVRRFLRGFFPRNLCGKGDEFVIKRRGNVMYVAGFLQYSKRFHPGKLYWMFGFAEEFLSNLLKQPVKLELQFVEHEEELRFTYVDWTDIRPKYRRR